METSCRWASETKLNSFVLEFPSVVAGVRWSAVQQAYAAEHGHVPTRVDLDATAEGSWFQWTEQGLHGHVVSDEPHGRVVKVAESRALSCLPGLLGTWPALYQALCAAVRGYGSLETGGLLLSRLHPRLGTEEINVQDGVAHRDLLRAWLDLPCWKKGNATYQEGLRYRDEDGVVRRLRKIGHLVKAIMHWRQQYRLTRMGQHTGVLLKALQPELRLEFSKANNNLMLYCTEDGIGDRDLSSSAVPLTVPSTIRKPIDLDNPFKWSSPSLADGHANMTHSTFSDCVQQTSLTVEPCPGTEEQPDAKSACQFELLQCWLGLICMMAQHKHLNNA